MLTELLLGIFLLTCFYLSTCLYLATRRLSGLPPGVWGWPVVGCLPSTGERMTDQVTKLRTTYGDIISWRIGCRVFVFLCNNDLVKSVLSRPEFADRPDLFTYDVLGGGSKTAGLIFTNGQQYTRNRGFFLRQLADPGLEMSMQYEGTCLVGDLKKHTKKSQPLPFSCRVAAMNVIWQLTAGTRFNVSDARIQNFSHLLNEITESFQGPVFLFNAFPWLIRVAPNFLMVKLGAERLLDNIKNLTDFIMPLIEEHAAKLDPANPRDLMDTYLLEMQKEADRPDSHLSWKEITVILIELFLAGSETTSAILYWAILYMAKYPDVQARIQREIDATVPRGTLPSLQDKDKLPCLRAMINEVQRIATVAPMGVAHCARQDTQIREYNIPKDTVIISHLESCHKDPQLWEKPEEFYLGHFLDEHGHFIPRKGELIPFAIGRRMCLGEPLASMELFIFLSALLQSFTFSAPEDEELIIERDPHELIINAPKKSNIVITERE